MKKCDRCKSNISESIIRADGLPSGVGFELESGKVITLCAACIMELGKRDARGKDLFFKELGIDKYKN